MSKIDYIIGEKAADIGNFIVGRVLPVKEKRHVGPFVFIDHMGPKEFMAGDNMAVLPHPHIGLSTLTYLVEGTIHHRDSMGMSLDIKAGEVNWMTAGRGVVHSERTPISLRDKIKRIHGLQLWVALPKEKEDMEPDFQHVDKADIPSWTENNVDYKLIAGKAFNKNSPVNVHSPLYFVELYAQKDSVVDLSNQLFGEFAIYVLDGSIKAEGQDIDSKHFVIANDNNFIFTIKEGSRVYLFGGEAFPEERFIHWNFVSSSKEKIEKAKLDWYNQNTTAFPKVIGDEEEFVPLPSYSLKYK